MPRKKGKQKAQNPEPEAAETEAIVPETSQAGESAWDSFDERAATGSGFFTLTNKELEDVLKAARALAQGEPRIIRPVWQRVRAPIVAVYHAKNGWLGLSLGRKWPAAGAFVAWLPPSLGARFRFPDKALIGMPVEVCGIWWTEDGGRTLNCNIATADQIRFLYPESPHLPPCDPARPGPETMEVGAHDSPSDDQAPPEATIG